MRIPVKILLPLLLILMAGLESCTCCAYFNHMWNAHEAYDKAAEMRTTRLDSIPGDTLAARGAERDLYDRVIEKGSRTLERFPDNQRQSSMAVFLIAESYRHKGEWSKAIQKYDEFERYFADHDSMPAAEYQRAYCLYRNRDYSISRFATERVLAKGTQHPYYIQALELMSLLHEQASFPEQAIAALEQLLASPGGTPFMRAKAHLRLAELYYRQQQWDKARSHYQAPDIAQLTPAERYIAAKNAAECLFQKGEFRTAADEYGTLAKLAENKNYLPEIQVRRGELLLLATDWPAGTKQLQECARAYPKTETAARAWYGLGDFEQMTRRDYPAAIPLYDSSFQQLPSSTWGRLSKERRDALLRLAKLKTTVEKQQKAKQPFFSDEFQIAELFLFKLSEVDSALGTLDRIAATTTDTLLAQRAAYAQAFVYDEFKHDSLTADSLYRRIIARWPTSQFARQAQENLGERVTVLTREDQAHSAFLAAESAWVAAQSIPVENIAEVEAGFAQALRLYDSTYVNYPDTRNGVQALYAKAQLFENEIGAIDSAKVAYMQLRDKHRETAWGQAANDKLTGRLIITDQELDQLRKRVKAMEESVEQARKRYLDNAQKQQELKIKTPDADDEVLQNDYDSLYDFR